MTPPPKIRGSSGMTLLELTGCIAALLALISILFMGARGWKRGSDRSVCLLTQRSMQMATRSYQNLYGYNYGGRPYAENGTQDITRHLLDKGYIEQPLFDQANGLKTCPANGSYSCPTRDVFPQAGELFMHCSLAASDAHEPTSHADW